MMVGCGEDIEVPKLIKCNGCGNEVSSAGEACANCSHPIADSVEAYVEAQELARIRAEEERRLAQIRAEEERQRLAAERAAKEEADRKRMAAYKAGLKKIGEKPFTVSELSMEMLWCKPGTFEMGSPPSEAGRDDNETQHKVTLTQGFWLGKHEVTQAQWKKVMGTAPSKFLGERRPVEQVDWSDAVRFCQELTLSERKAGRIPDGWEYALPTEAQWEYACRAGTAPAYSWGNSIATSNANYSSSGIGQTTDVGQYAANPWGFFDM
ncbi:uncharacterized protein METZ01_LOCUS431582, partial [marine metagenome]